MTTIPWFKFYTTDWRSDPCLGMCGLAAQGLWMKMLCLMHEAKPRGYLMVAGEQPNLEQLARLVGAPTPLVADCLGELERNKVFSRDRYGTIYSRKMLREGRASESARRNGAEGGNPEMRRGTASKAERTRPFKRAENPAKARRIFERDEGRCHWCGTPLVYDGPPAPNLYQPDYLIPLADGGTSAEDNLVAACSECKHRRALRGWPFDLKLRNFDPAARRTDAATDRATDAVGCNPLKNNGADSEPTRPNGQDRAFDRRGPVGRQTAKPLDEETFPDRREPTRTGAEMAAEATDRSLDPVGSLSVEGVGKGVGSGRCDSTDAVNPSFCRDNSTDPNRRPQPTPNRDAKPQNQIQSQNQKAAASSNESDAASPDPPEAGTAAWVILSFDEERVAVYGIEHARPFRYSVDAGFSREIAASGLSPEQIRVAFRGAFQRRKAAGQPPPSHLGYMRPVIRDAAYAAQFAPLPPNPKRPYLKPGDFDPDEERRRLQNEALGRRIDAEYAAKRKAG